jgi:hypothetical protein
MNVIRIVLYVASALVLATAILAFLPWGTLNAFMGWFGPFAYPDEPLVQYTVKVIFVVFAWLGVVMAVAVRRPEEYELLLLILGLLFLSVAGFCLVIGWVYGVAWFFYLDAAFSAAVGVLFVVYRSQALAQESSAV